MLYVLSEAQRVFNQHWVLFTLDGILFDAYRERERWFDAATHQTKRIQYATQVAHITSRHDCTFAVTGYPSSFLHPGLVV